MQASKTRWLGTLLLALPFAAFATDGYFQHGYGLKAQGMGGAATASTADTLGGANNPATMVWAGNRVDAGLLLFSPERSASRSGAGPFSGKAKSSNEYFVVPDFGINHLVNDRLSLGVSVYGNGGMDTRYSGKTLGGANNLLGGTGALGVDMQQLIVAPTLAVKVSDSQSLGVSPLLVYQRFKAYGLQAFAGMSQSPTRVTDNGADSSTGAGVRVGWFGKLSDRLSLGAAYSPQTRMSRFHKYEGLFAQRGRFDVPENYNVGAAFQVTEAFQFALDYQRINYRKLHSVGNDSRLPPPLLGTSGGAGFGWQNVNVVKLGVQYDVSRDWTLRAGYNHTENPIRKQDVTFNILAPGVIKHHATVGFTHTLQNKGELTFSYMHAFDNSVTGQSLLGGTEKIRMHEDSVGLGYGYNF